MLKDAHTIWYRQAIIVQRFNLSEYRREHSEDIEL